MRAVRVLLRRKSRITDPSQTVKVVTNCRIRGRKRPIQIHLGYLSLRFATGVPSGQREKLLGNLRKKWRLLFNTDQVDIDWNDAEKKLGLLQASLTKHPEVVDQKAPADHLLERGDNRATTETAPGLPLQHWVDTYPSSRQTRNLGTFDLDERGEIARSGDHMPAFVHATPRLDAHPMRPLRAMPRKNHTILFLAANPSGTHRIDLDREARAIQIELEGSGFRDCFEFETRWAAEPLDLLRALRKLRPTVVHFSGAGGLHFQNHDGRPQLISAEALAETFGAAGASVKLVVFNACYDEAQAEALLAHVDCVVGVGSTIRDDAARSFAIGFYGGLGERESVAVAFKHGRAAISLVRSEGHHDDRPQLRVRAGVDPRRLVLAGGPLVADALAF